MVFEGIMAFTNRKLLDLMDLKIFVDTDADVRLARRYCQYCVWWWDLTWLPSTGCVGTFLSEEGTSLEC